MHVDRYKNYTELARNETFGKDFVIIVRPREPSRIAVIAPHGGKIEPRTSEIARQIAGDDFNLYLFQGTKNEDNYATLHITSSRFDEPSCLSLISKCEIVIAVHGSGGTEQRVLLGGLDVSLKNEIRSALRSEGVEVETHNHAFPAIDPMNICNRGKTGQGVQIEISRGLRGSENEDRVVSAVRRVLLSITRATLELAATDLEAAVGVGVTAELLADTKRQAVPSIRGDVYQAWWSIDAWLRLTSADEVIYLEGAEDFDVIRETGAVAVQVKHRSDSISLALKKVLDALEAFWALVLRDPARQVDFHYLTTSAIATEQDANFDGLSGIEAWRVARTSPDLTERLATYLAQKLDTQSPLRAFLASATTSQIQKRFIKRVHWLTNQPDIEVVRQSVDDRISVLLHDQHRSISLASSVQKFLWFRFWEVIVEKESAKRCLNFADLLRQVQAATTTYLPIPLDQLPDLVASANAGVGLLDLLFEKSPAPPQPLLRRPALTQQVEDLVKGRRVALLTGTVHKGKTTIAQLVAATLCPTAWWLNVTERKADQVDNLLLALARRIDRGDCPSLVVVDDLDVGPNAHRVYRDSLALVLHRARSLGVGILLTAQGTSAELISAPDFKNIEVLEVSELGADEVQALCIEHGCEAERAGVWAALIQVWTRGHPKLVQVQVAEQAARGWPSPGPNDLMAQPSSVVSVRQMARRLLGDSVSPAIAEFVYTASESLVPMRRSIAIRIAESLDRLPNAGDVLDSLTGKWIERLSGDQLRVTSLLQGVATEVWSPEKRKLAHIRLHDAIVKEQSLSPAEAASLLYHAYIAAERSRIALTAMRLQLIQNHDAKREVERHLLWLPYVALEANKPITDDAVAAANLRGLQFRVASTLDAESLPSVCERWAEEVQRIEHAEMRVASQALMWLSIGSAESLKVPLKARLEAIIGASTLKGESAGIVAQATSKAFGDRSVVGETPSNGTSTQMMLLIACRCVRDAESLQYLVDWLDETATDSMRKEFDSMLEWPLVQTLGAFVQGAWATKHDETTDWEQWLPFFYEWDSYAKRRASLNFGREVAKAKAIVLTEYLDRPQDALATLEQAETSFGPSMVLSEQRANVLFHTGDDEKVLEIWNKLTKDPSNSIFRDPFACRRAAMSAARLSRWNDAEGIFRTSADSIKLGELEVTKFGLKVDGALAASLGGRHISAAKLLAEAVLGLPGAASDEGNERWEAVQRAAAEVCRNIEKAVWKPKDAEPKFSPGYASSPDLKVSKIESGQAARSEMLRVQVFKLCAMLGVDLPLLKQEILSLSESKYFIVRWYAVEAQVALAFQSGAGDEFIETLLTFDGAIDGLSRRDRNKSFLIPDDSSLELKSSAPERWFGFLVAGICCAGTDLLDKLRLWLDSCRRLLGPTAPLTCVVQDILGGANLPVDELRKTVRTESNSAAPRCGAAARLLMEPLRPEEALNLQAFLASAFAGGESFPFQELFNRHVAHRFLSTWRTYAQSPFLFRSPRTSVPALIQVFKDFEKGSATLRTLLRTASEGLGEPLGGFFDRIL